MMINEFFDGFFIEWIMLVVYIVKKCIKCSIEKCSCILVYI